MRTIELCISQSQTLTSSSYYGLDSTVKDGRRLCVTLPDIYLGHKQRSKRLKGVACQTSAIHHTESFDLGHYKLHHVHTLADPDSPETDEVFGMHHFYF